MQEISKIADSLEKVGFPAKDFVSAQKILKMQHQLEDLGVEKEVAQKSLLSMFSKEKDPPRREKMIEIFRQSTLSGEVKSDFFDLKGKLQYLEGELSQYGFNRNDFLPTALKCPTLLCIGAEKFKRNVIAMDKAYKAQGLSGADFLKMCKKEPNLAGYDFETLHGKIQTLQSTFSRYGITMNEISVALKKQPNLLAVKPENVIYKAQILLNHHAHHFWQVGLNKKETATDALRCILLTRPMGLNLSVQNLRGRRLYAMSCPTESLRLGTYLRGKQEVQKRVETYLIKQGRTTLLDKLYKKGYFEKENCA